MSDKIDKRNWKIIYSDYSGMEKKAVELVSKEMGALILRDKGVYTIHVLACEKQSSPIHTLSRSTITFIIFQLSSFINKILLRMCCFLLYKPYYSKS